MSDDTDDDLSVDEFARTYSEGDAIIETNIFRAWLDEDDSDDVRFETRILQDGPFLALGVGYRDDDPDTDARVTAGVTPTPDEAREIGHALLDAADATEAARQESKPESPDQSQTAADGRLRSFLQRYFA